jgi:hypothetical protein
MNGPHQAWRGKPAGASANKYRAVKTTIGTETFDSKAEANRWTMLRLMQRAGEISDLCRQAKFPLYVGDWLIGLYVADFAYRRGGKLVAEDVKGVKTPLFNWKALHFRAQYGFDIEVVR